MPAEPSLASQMLGTRFREARQHAGITQMDLANLAGINVANYGKIERGIGNPNFETLVRLADVLGVDAGSLLAGIRARDFPDATPTYSAAEYVRELERRRRTR